MEPSETDGGALGFSEALDMALGTGREKVPRIVNISTLCLFLLSLSMLYMTYGDPLVFNLMLGFVAITVVFAAIFNWTMALMDDGKMADEPQEADERGAVEDKKAK